MDELLCEPSVGKKHCRVSDWTSYEQLEWSDNPSPELGAAAETKTGSSPGGEIQSRENVMASHDDPILAQKLCSWKSRQFWFFFFLSSKNKLSFKSLW